VNSSYPAIVSWWGELEVEPGQSLHFLLGPLDLWVTRDARAWRVFARTVEDRPVAAVHAGGPPPELAVRSTVLVPSTTSPLSVAPALPDRAVVARPSSPVYVPGGETAEVYLSTPLWIRLADSGGERFLYEVASTRLSDTWLGRTTVEGQLCYGHRPVLATTFADVVPHPARAVTKVTVKNSGNAPLLLERVAIPAAHLSLFSGENGHFWTQPVSIAGDKYGLTDLDISGAMVPESRGARPVAQPRIHASSGLARVYDAMFG